MTPGKYNTREGWQVSERGLIIFEGNAGDALMAYDDALHEFDNNLGGTLALITPRGHKISLAVFPTR